MRVNKKYALALFIALSAAILLIFYSFIMGDKEFILVADQKYQYNVFYEEWIRLLKEFVNSGFKALPFYSFNSFLGLDFFASKIYYVVGDIFTLFIPLFQNIEFATLVYTIILIYISGFSMYYLLLKIGVRHKFSFIGGFVYALSGIALLYFGNYMFHRFYALFPILLYGVESYVRNKKYCLFIFMVFYMFAQNYYFMYSASIFLIYYYFLTNYIKGKYNVIKILKSAVRLICAYFIGVLMASIFIIPTLIYLSQSARVGAMSDTFLWDFNVYVGLLTSLITQPLNMYTNIPNLFYSGTNGHAQWYSLSTSIVFFVIFLSSLFKDNILLKKIRNIFLIMLVFVVFCPLNSIIHGFSEPSFRWVFVFIPFIIIVSLVYLERFDITIDSYKYYSIYFALCLVGLFVMIATGFEINEYLFHYIFIFFSLIMGYLYLLLLNKKLYFTIFLLVFLELSIGARFLVNQYSNDYQMVEDTSTEEYLEYYQTIDEDRMYRTYINKNYYVDTSSLNLNQSVSLNYLSTQTYDSTYNQQINEYLSWKGIDWHIIDINDHKSHKFLGVKYVIVENEDMLIDSELYEYVYDLNHYKVYKLKDFKGIGYTFNRFIKKSDFLALEKKDEFDFSEFLILNDDDYDKHSYLGANTGSAKFEVVYYGENQIYGSVDTVEDCILFMSIPNDQGWKIYDGEYNKLESIEVSGGFIGIPLEKGKHFITMQYTTPGFKLGLYLSVMGFAVFISIMLMSLYKKRKAK